MQGDDERRGDVGDGVPDLEESGELSGDVDGVEELELIGDVIKYPCWSCSGIIYFF